MTASLPTALARDAALLRFSVLHGETDLTLPSSGKTRVSRGTVTGTDGRAIGTITASRHGYVVTDSSGAQLSRLSALGFSEEGGGLTHPAYPGDGWRDRVRQYAGAAALGAGAASGAVSGGHSSADLADDLPKKSGFPIGLAVGVIAIVAVGGLAVAFMSGNADAPAVAAADLASAKSEATPEAVASSGEKAPGGGGKAASAAVAAPEEASAAATLAGGSATSAGGSAASAGSDAERSPSAAPEPEPEPPAKAPAVAAAAAPAKKPAKPAKAAQKQERSAPPAKEARSQPSPSRSAPRAKGTHVVEPGDSLSELAHSLGLRGRDEISGFIEGTMRLNGISDANVVTVGDSLRLPDTAPPPAWTGEVYTAEEYPGF